MTQETIELSGLVARLEKLEKQNRRFEHAGLVVVLALGALVLMGQARTRLPQAVPSRTLEGTGLILRDAAGKNRVVIQPDPAALWLYGPDGKPAAQLGALPDGPALLLHGPDGKYNASLQALQITAGLGLLGPDGKLVASFLAGADGARLMLTDPKGFQSVLGVNDLVTPSTGETHKTSAASLTLFDSKQNLIWKAP